MPYSRDLLNKLMKFIDRKEILGLRGARQVGKTTLLKILQEKLENLKKVGNCNDFENPKKLENTSSKIKIVFLNLDFMNLREELQQNPLAIIERYGGNENRLYLFLDEIQNVENAGMILKFLYDEFPHIKIIFSGSSSLEIRKRILPSLVGRLFLFNLYSFSFCEFVEARDTGLRKIIDNRKKGLEKIVKTLELLKDKDKEKNYDLLHEIIDKMPKPAFVDEVIALLKEYMIWGGYPEVIKTSDGELKKTILQNIITLYLEKDIISFFKIRDSTKFFKLSTLLATQPGGFVVNSEISSELHLSRNTVDSYLEILQHSYIIHLLSPYHKNLRNELRKQEKIYFLDHGIRNALISNFTPFDNRSGPEKGCLLENFVFGELLKKLMPYLEGYEVKYWRTTNKTEVDFVLVSKSNSLLIPIEVKLGGKKVSRGFYSFIREYGIKLAFVATLNVFKIEKHDDFTMLWIPVYYF